MVFLFIFSVSGEQENQAKGKFFSGFICTFICQNDPHSVKNKKFLLWSEKGRHP